MIHQPLIASHLYEAIRLYHKFVYSDSTFPAVNCAHDKNFDAPLFYEIYICLDKEFNRIGCENTKGGTYGSCGKSRPFLYPETIHPNCEFEFRDDFL